MAINSPADRIILIVLDSVGIGALPDANEYGDEGADTLGNILHTVDRIKIPHLESMGLGKIKALPGLDSYLQARGIYGKMAEASAGKDTTTGHWELAGIIKKEPFPVYPSGFPREVIEEFTDKTGKQILGNKAASGTVIIEELGTEHLSTGYPIVYTSADSVFQIAAHEEVISVSELYKLCRTARSLLTGQHAVARVIARPFVGQPGSFERTEKRKDFSLAPPEETMLDKIKKEGQTVAGAGKIDDIFAGQGLTTSSPAKCHPEVVKNIIDYMKTVQQGLIFANLIEFDMLYGHRRDVEGYARALERFDRQLPDILQRLKEKDILVITADHGCDPTFQGTDHTREFVPLLMTGSSLKKDFNLGVRNSFADLAASICDLLGTEGTNWGTSFFKKIMGGAVNGR